jgi:exopolysaccharide biosynthesis polyprenyl glycosylphosphotransferase
MDRAEVARIIYDCERNDIAYKLVADIFALVSLTTRVVHLGGTTMIESVPPPLSGSRVLVKRALDLLITVPLIVLLLPAGLLIAAAIVVDSGFPVFYRQTRLGRENRPFTILKFRSMRVGADSERQRLRERNEASGPLFKIRRDPRVTRVGAFLRKWSLDELPQLLNVLAGRMSLVGPRPPLPEEVEQYSEKQLKRLRALPGITGVWQVSGRSELGFEDMVKLDLYYVDNWSIWMDLSIMLLTLPAVLSSRGAY